MHLSNQREENEVTTMKITSRFVQLNYLALLVLCQIVKAARFLMAVLRLVFLWEKSSSKYNYRKVSLRLP